MIGKGFGIERTYVNSFERKRNNNLCAVCVQDNLSHTEASEGQLLLKKVYYLPKGFLAHMGSTLGVLFITRNHLSLLQETSLLNKWWCLLPIF